MVLEHVEEDEDAVTKGKADEKQKKVIMINTNIWEIQVKDK